MRSGRLHYAWVVAGLTFLVLLVAAGIRAALSVLIVPLEAEFHWTRSIISFAIAVNIILYGLTGPFAAALMERFGIRRVMALALVITVLGLALTPLMTEPWQLVMLWGVAVGLASGVTAVVLGATVAARWFTHRRGLVMGVITASTACGQLVFLPLFAAIAESMGWRAVAIASAATAAVLLPLVVIFMRDRPYDVGISPYGDPRPPQPPAPMTENPMLRALTVLRDGFRSRDFWLLSGSFFVCGVSTNGLVGTHLIPACIEAGMPEVTAAGLLAGMGVFNFAGAAIAGWMADRYDGRYLLAWFYGLRGLSLLLLPFALDGGYALLSIFALFYGLDWIATVPPTVRLSAKCFGEQSAPIYFGWILAIHQIGAAAAAWGAGLMRVEFGDYFAAFLIAAATCFIATAMVLVIGKRNRPDSIAIPASAHA